MVFSGDLSSKIDRLVPNGSLSNRIETRSSTRRYKNNANFTDHSPNSSEIRGLNLHSAEPEQPKHIKHFSKELRNNNKYNQSLEQTEEENYSRPTGPMTPNTIKSQTYKIIKHRVVKDDIFFLLQRKVRDRSFDRWEKATAIHEPSLITVYYESLSITDKKAFFQKISDLVINNPQVPADSSQSKGNLFEILKMSLHPPAENYSLSLKNEDANSINDKIIKDGTTNSDTLNTGVAETKKTNSISGLQKDQSVVATMFDSLFPGFSNNNKMLDRFLKLKTNIKKHTHTETTENSSPIPSHYRQETHGITHYKRAKSYTELSSGHMLVKDIPISISPIVSANIKIFLSMVKDLNGPPISIVNTVDDVPPPTDFTFLNESIYALNVPRPQQFDVIPCSCEPEDINPKSALCHNYPKYKNFKEFTKSQVLEGRYLEEFCHGLTEDEVMSKLYRTCNYSSSPNQERAISCSHNNEMGNPYNNLGLLILPNQIPIYECNYLCECGPFCFNRVVQRGPTVELQIFRTRNKGWGIRTLQTLQKGQFIAEYVGEIITNREAERRGKQNDKLGCTYLFDLDFEIGSDEVPHYTIDAEKFGNITHFLNHSCAPNLKIRAVYVNHWDKKLHKLAFFTTERILAGSELTFDYNPTAPFPDEPGYIKATTVLENPHTKHQSRPTSKATLRSPADYNRFNNSVDFSLKAKSVRKENFFRHKGYVCYCGAPRCRGFVFNE